MDRAGVKTVVVTLLAGYASGCDNHPSAALIDSVPVMAQIASEISGVPDRTGTWVLASDSALWEAIELSNGVAHIGWKAPGRRRGYFAGQRLISSDQLQAAYEATSKLRGIEIIETDTLLPNGRLKIPSMDAMSRLRDLPFVDYLEPARIIRNPNQPFIATLGCSIVSGYNGPTTGSRLTSLGDQIPWNYDSMHIPRAWSRSNGSGITVGLIDTGIDIDQLELTTSFTSGNSSGRTRFYTAPNGQSWVDDCGHGTRMAGIISAPYNGNNIIGVAWKSNLISARHLDDVVFTDALNTRNAIRIAAQAGAQIIAMAFQSQDDYNLVYDEIDYWYEEDRLFIGAAGTSTCNWNSSYGVVFPARMVQVVAVTANRADGSVACNAHYGPAVELSALIGDDGQQTTGAVALDAGEMVSLEGSSAATAVIAGIAALIWSENPTFPSHMVRYRLQQAGHLYPYRSSNVGYGQINAWTAVGGLSFVGINGPSWVNPSVPTQYTFTADPHIGTGPFTYEWTTAPSSILVSGGSGPSITVSVGPNNEPDFV